MNYNNVFCKQFDQNEHISPSEFSSAGIKIGVWINSGGLNSLGRPKFELGSLSRKVRRLNRAFVLYYSWKINRQIIRIIESKSTHSSWIFRKLVQFSPISETGIWFALTSGYSGRLCYAHFNRENQIFEMSFNLFSDFKEPHSLLSS